MPINRYNSAFGGKSGSAQKAFDSMRSQYGGKRGTSIFYATINKRAPGLQQRRRNRLRASTKRRRPRRRAMASR